MNRYRVFCLLLLVFLLAATCDSRRSGGSSFLTDPRVPEAWVRPEWSPAWWHVLAEVRDFVGEERWSALDTAWMEEKARADLVEWGPGNQNPSEMMLSGLFRLGILEEEVLAAIAELDGEPVWPLPVDRRHQGRAWRPRVERWRRARSDPELRERLDASWSEAVAAGDPENMARVVRAYDAWLGSEVADPLGPVAMDAVRRSIDARERGLLPGGVVFLMERFGVPDGVALGPVISEIQDRYRELEDAVMPLPHPYDLHLQCLRLSRLRPIR